jgi:hypothetical protein
MDYKNCFTCKQELPLNAFNPSSMKYQLKTDKNVMRVCKKCTFFKVIKQLSMIKYNFEIMKFEIIEFENAGEVAEYFTKNNLI